jgi:hypothetical protein
LGRTIDIHYNNIKGIEEASALKLSVLLETDSFFYWVTDHNDKVVRIEQVDGNDLTPLHELNATKWCAAFSHENGQLIPDEWSDETLSDLFAQMHGGITPWRDFAIDKAAARLYLNPEKLPAGWTSSSIDMAQAKPIASHFLFPAFVEKGLIDEELVHLHFMEQQIFLAAYRGGKLLLWQVIPLNSPHELQYFTLLVYFQFHLDRTKVPLLLSGRISSGSQMYQLLFPYFKEIKWANLAKQNHQLQLPETIPAHYLADLWLIHQCES